MPTDADQPRPTPPTPPGTPIDGPLAPPVAPAVATQDEAVVARFVEAWGRMGSVWGISRTMAEIHALLYITGSPMCADDIMERLAISRGNASMSLRSLLDWGIVTRAHRRGDRKDYFQAEEDVWAVFRAIVRERKKREVDPLLVSLHELRDHTGTPDAAPSPEMDARLDRMLDFFEMASDLAERFIGPSGRGLRLAATILAKTPSGKSKAANKAGADQRRPTA